MKKVFSKKALHQAVSSTMSMLGPILMGVGFGGGQEILGYIGVSLHAVGTYMAAHSGE